MIAKKRTLTCMAVFIFVFAVLLCGMPRDAYGVSFSKDKTFGNVWTVAPTGDGIGRNRASLVSGSGRGDLHTALALYIYSPR